MSPMDLIHDNESPTDRDLTVEGNGNFGKKAVIRRWMGAEHDQCIILPDGESAKAISMSREQTRAFGLACIKAANFPNPGEG